MAYATVTIDDTDYELESEADWMLAEDQIQAIAQIGFGLLRLRLADGELVVLLNHGSTLKYRVHE